MLKHSTLSLFLLLAAALSCFSQTTTTYTLNVGAGYNCGRASTPLYCYGLPVTGGGSFWIDTYVSGYYAGRGFILWNGVANLGEAMTTGNETVLNGLGQVSQLSTQFAGTTNDGSNTPYTGTMTLTFTYYYSSGGGGKGGGGAGWRFICTGGTFSITE